MQKSGEPKMPEFISWFNELEAKDTAKAGAKGAGLATIQSLHLKTPPGFIINKDAYNYFVSKTGIQPKITVFLKTLESTKEPPFVSVSSQIKDLFKNAEMPRELQEAIEEAYDFLDADARKIQNEPTALEILKSSYIPPPVAVRTSVITDEKETSFTGMHDNFLNVQGAESLVKEVKNSFASIFNARALEYRQRQGIGLNLPVTAVIVQKMVDAKKSGVVLSKDPLSAGEQIVVESVWGLGNEIGRAHV